MIIDCMHGNHMTVTKCIIRISYGGGQSMPTVCNFETRSVSHPYYYFDSEGKCSPMHIHPLSRSHV